MVIEHRYRARQPIDIPVQILYRKRRFRGARGRNLSDQGMSLEIRDLTLPTGTMVVLEFHEAGRAWTIPAIVVHADASGIGVMFRDAQTDLLQSSQTLEMQTRPLRLGAIAPQGLLA